jgi:2-hydroxy-3-keto-5-methylthiopentenyl-1-phosphate phosphatase
MLPFQIDMRIYCDFDGTITNRDSIVFLTEYFGGGSEFREEVLAAIKEGSMSVFEAIRLEMATVKTSWENAAAVLREKIQVDPTFGNFVKWTRKSGFDLTVLSSGMEPVIELFLKDFQVPFRGHRVLPLETGWVYERNPEHDKERILKLAKESIEGDIVFIGDGTSDLSAIPYADLLFAREGFYLSEYCQAESIPHMTFVNFSDIQEKLEKL